MGTVGGEGDLEVHAEGQAALDPAVKRLALEVPDHTPAHNDFEGRLDGGGVVVWDRGSYEQGGRVAWPEALERGHAVFVLHGQKLNSGFALQRTRAGAKGQWLLIKRRDEHARPGSDIVAEQPASILSGAHARPSAAGRAAVACRACPRGDPPLIRRFNPRVPLRDNTTRKPRKSPAIAFAS